MKRTTTLTLAVVFSLVALTAFAATPAVRKAVSHGTELKGSVASLDSAAKSFVLNTGKMNDTIYWTTATKVHGGTLKADENVVVRAMQKDGKWVATSVRIERAATKTARK